MVARPRTETPGWGDNRTKQRFSSSGPAGVSGVLHEDVGLQGPTPGRERPRSPRGLGRDGEAGDRSRRVRVHTWPAPGLPHTFLRLGVIGAQPACPGGVCPRAGPRAAPETVSQNRSTRPERRPGFCGTSRAVGRWIVKCRQIPRFKSSSVLREFRNPALGGNEGWRAREDATRHSPFCPPTLTPLEPL